MDINQLFFKCNNFRIMTEGQVPLGDDTPLSAIKFSEEWENKHITDVITWTPPKQFDKDKKANEIFMKIKELAQKQDVKLVKQICEKMEELLIHLNDNYDIVQ